MRIGELADATSTDTATLRYYEEIGLLLAPLREANGYRHYPEQAVHRVNFIRHCRALDLSLSEIERLIVLTEEPEANCDDLNLLLDTHLAQVRSRQATLARLEERLVSLRGRCGSSRRAGECGILHELKQAVNGGGSSELENAKLARRPVADCAKIHHS